MLHAAVLVLEDSVKKGIWGVLRGFIGFGSFWKRAICITMARRKKISRTYIEVSIPSCKTAQVARSRIAWSGRALFAGQSGTTWRILYGAEELYAETRCFSL